MTDWAEAMSFSEASILFEAEEHVRLHGGRLTDGSASWANTQAEPTDAVSGGEPSGSRIRDPGPSVSRPLPIHARGKAPQWNPPQRPQIVPKRLGEDRLRELLR